MTRTTHIRPNVSTYFTSLYFMANITWKKYCCLCIFFGWGYACLVRSRVLLLRSRSNVMKYRIKRDETCNFVSGKKMLYLEGHSPDTGKVKWFCNFQYMVSVDERKIAIGKISKSVKICLCEGKKKHAEPKTCKCKNHWCVAQRMMNYCLRKKNVLPSVSFFSLEELKCNLVYVWVDNASASFFLCATHFIRTFRSNCYGGVFSKCSPDFWHEKRVFHIWCKYKASANVNLWLVVISMVHIWCSLD